MISFLHVWLQRDATRAAFRYVHVGPWKCRETAVSCRQCLIRHWDLKWNRLAQAASFCVYIQKVLFSDLGRETDCLDWFLSWFSRALQKHSRFYTWSAIDSINIHSKSSLGAVVRVKPERNINAVQKIVDVLGTVSVRRRWFWALGTVSVRYCERKASVVLSVRYCER